MYIETDCPICLSEISDSFFVTTCGHTYHIKCIERWLEQNTKCPLCNKVLKTSKPKVNTDEFNHIMLFRDLVMIQDPRARRAFLASRLRECRSLEIFVIELFDFVIDNPLW